MENTGTKIFSVSVVSFMSFLWGQVRDQFQVHSSYSSLWTHNYKETLFYAVLPHG